MTRRAPFSQAELDRAARAAAKAGLELRIVGNIMRLLPLDGKTALPSDEDAESAWDKALGLQS